MWRSFSARLLSRLFTVAESHSGRLFSTIPPYTSRWILLCQNTGLQSTVLTPWHHQLRSCSATAAKLEKVMQDNKAAASIGELVIKLEAEALQLAGEGHPERASQMMQEAYDLVSSTPEVGESSTEAASIVVSHVSILQRVGMFKQLVEVALKRLPSLESVENSSIIRSVVLLRLAAAYINTSELVKASETLEQCGMLLEKEAEEKLPPFIVPEFQFYCTIMNLSIAKEAQDVAALDNMFLSAASGMAAALPSEVQGEFPYLISALHTHSKLIHEAINAGVPHRMVQAMFSQAKTIHRAAGCSREAVAMVDYQYGTWMYAETEDLQQARDIVEKSMQEIQKAQEESQKKNAGRGSKESEDGDGPDADDANWEHQIALRRFRLAVIDTIMVATNAKASSPELSSSTQGTLSTIAAAYEDLLGSSNAISSECRFCLSVWGVIEGMLERDGDAVVSDAPEGPDGERLTVRQQLQHKMLLCLKSMADEFAEGEANMLCQKLLKVGHDLVGDLVAEVDASPKFGESDAPQAIEAPEPSKEGKA